MCEKYPEKSLESKTLLMKVAEVECHGCYTCKFYDSISKDTFVDVDCFEGLCIPFGTEEAWVYCSKSPDNDTSLRIECECWQILEKY
ncbi:MAG: hypothetical protein K0B07_01300 [DPANN group archaeon]|nr:hypothetical protein [DPANN group archaeon]